MHLIYLITTCTQKCDRLHIKTEEKKCKNLIERIYFMKVDSSDRGWEGNRTDTLPAGFVVPHTSFMSIYKLGYLAEIA